MAATADRQKMIDEAVRRTVEFGGRRSSTKWPVAFKFDPEVVLAEFRRIEEAQ